MTFLDTAAVHVPAAPTPAVEVPRTPELVPCTTVPAVALGPPHPPRRTLTRVNRPTRSDLANVAPDPFVSMRLEAPPTAPLESRIMAAAANAPMLALSLPSSQSATASPPREATAPWEAVRISTASAASDVARAAAATGARARSTGVSIGRFFTRASKAGTNAF